MIYLWSFYIYFRLVLGLDFSVWMMAYRGAEQPLPCPMDGNDQDKETPSPSSRDWSCQMWKGSPHHGHPMDVLEANNASDWNQNSAPNSLKILCFKVKSWNSSHCKVWLLKFMLNLEGSLPGKCNLERGEMQDKLRNEMKLCPGSQVVKSCYLVVFRLRHCTCKETFTRKVYFLDWGQKGCGEGCRGAPHFLEPGWTVPEVLIPELVTSSASGKEH